jgi:hypothetical protein
MAARASSVHRALRIYRAHLLTIGSAFVLGSFFLAEFPGVRYLLDHYLVHPWSLRPFLLIGRHMLPVFCSQICLSLLLIGRTESDLTTEPVILRFSDLSAANRAPVRLVSGKTIEGWKIGSLVTFAVGR